MAPTNPQIDAAIAAADAVLRAHKMPICAAEFAEIRREMFAAAVEAAEWAGWSADMEAAPKICRIIMCAGEMDGPVYVVGEGYWNDEWRWTIDRRATPTPTRWRLLPEPLPTPPAEQGGQ